MTSLAPSLPTFNLLPGLIVFPPKQALAFSSFLCSKAHPHSDFSSVLFAGLPAAFLAPNHPSSPEVTVISSNAKETISPLMKTFYTHTIFSKIRTQIPTMAHVGFCIVRLLPAFLSCLPHLPCCKVFMCTGGPSSGPGLLQTTAGGALCFL